MFTELYPQKYTKIEQALRHDHIIGQEIMTNSETGQK